MSAVLTGHADDVIDDLLRRSGGAVLRGPIDGVAGEYDSYRQGLSSRDVRRLVGAGLLSRRDGFAADVLLGVFDGCHELNADEFVDFWCRTGLAGLDARAVRRDGSEVLERCDEDWADWDAERTGMLLGELVGVAPAWFGAWCDRTVHGPKLGYLARLGAAQWLGAGVAVPPAAGWADKVGRQFCSRCRR